MRTDFTLCFPGRLLCRISPRFHLRMICCALELEPYVWQRAFALGRINSLPGKRTRGNGKTTAVMLRLLMLPPNLPQSDVAKVLSCDSDWQGGFTLEHRLPYCRKYRELWLHCAMARVPVSDYYGLIFDRFRYN